MSEGGREGVSVEKLYLRHLEKGGEEGEYVALQSNCTATHKKYAEKEPNAKGTSRRSLLPRRNGERSR